MHITNELLIAEMEETVKSTGLAATTIAGKLHLGTNFLTRRRQGYSMLPETAERALKALRKMRGADNLDVRVTGQDPT